MTFIIICVAFHFAGKTANFIIAFFVSKANVHTERALVHISTYKFTIIHDKSVVTIAVERAVSIHALGVKWTRIILTFVNVMTLSKFSDKSLDKFKIEFWFEVQTLNKQNLK